MNPLAIHTRCALIGTIMEEVEALKKREALSQSELYDAAKRVDMVRAITDEMLADMRTTILASAIRFQLKTDLL